MIGTLVRPEQDDVFAVAGRMRAHERRFRELHAAGRRQEAFFEAESAEILARWLTAHGIYPELSRSA